MFRWMLMGGLVLALAVSPWVLAADLTSPEWCQWRGPKRDALSPDTGLLAEWPKEGPPLVWETSGLGTGFSSVSVAGGRIFTMGDRADACCVIALDAASGKELWTAKVGRTGGGGGYPGPRCTPTVDGGLVYALGQFGDLVCLEAATGKELWRKNLPKDFGGQAGGWGYSESPLVDGEKLVCTPGGKSATLIALHKRTGKPLWKGVVPGGDTAAYSSIVMAEVGGIRQYIQLLANGVVGLAAKDGRFLWRYGNSRERFAGNTANIPTAVVRGDYVFCSAGYGRGGGLIKLIPNRGGIQVQEVYFKQELNNKHGGVVLVGEYLYGDRDASGRLWCAEFLTGKVVWQREPARSRGAGRGSAAIAYADGHLYVRYDNGVMALVEATPDGYEEKSSFKIPHSTSHSWSHPVIIGGRLYLREQDWLLCYDVKQ